MGNSLHSIPAKRYFTIGDVGDLCGVKPHVLRYWEQEFTQLRPMKRRGNRRYYQHHEVLMIRRIRDLLYDQGFTISGARNKLQEIVQGERDRRRNGEVMLDGVGPDIGPDPDADIDSDMDDELIDDTFAETESLTEPHGGMATTQVLWLRAELMEIRDLLKDSPEPGL
ncbi:MAG: MerR family transcriptional regulator [Rhodoferax sp.]|nr:MerR family transcriptional regulator [Rhodoferax sp.]